jgi:putative SOS response-associated peptidase YedK
VTHLARWCYSFDRRLRAALTVLFSNPWRNRLRQKSAIIPLCAGATDGFYEWQRTGKTKQPFCFEVHDGELFGFAGLWERRKHPSGNWVQTCAILTTTPNAVTVAVRDRMPVILDPDSYDLWLDPGFNDVAAASDLLKPYEALAMRAHPVSARISSVANDDPECSAPVEVPEAQARLF